MEGIKARWGRRERIVKGVSEQESQKKKKKKKKRS